MDNSNDIADSENKLTLLEFDGITIAFPQSHILTIESLDQINTLLTTENSSGSLKYNSIEIPVYTFNKDLTMQPKSSEKNRFCIGIKNEQENRYFALMCDAVYQYSLNEHTVNNDIPCLMRNSQSPIIRLANIENKLILISSADSMSKYINTQDTSYMENINNG